MDRIFISVEGIDGVGKTTASNFLENNYRLVNLHQSLSKSIGKKKYDEERDAANKFKDNNLVDFYMKSYKEVSKYPRVVADRFIGSLWFWGRSDKNEKYMIENISGLRKPNFGILLTASESVLRKRLEKRGSSVEIKKIKHQEQLVKSTKEVYKFLNIPLVIIDTSNNRRNVEDELSLALEKYMNNELIESEREFKLMNILQLFGFIQSKYNIYEKGGIIFNVNSGVLSLNGSKYFIDGKKDYSKLIYLIMSKPKDLHEKAIIFGVKNIDNYKYFSFKINNGIKEINTNLWDEKETNIINGDKFMDNELNSFCISSDVTQIGDNPFAGWEMKPDTNSKRFIFIGDFLIDKDNGILIAYFGDGENVVIPEEVQTIGKHAFYKKNIKSIILGSNIKNIFNNPFSHSTNVNVKNESKYFKIVKKCLLSTNGKILISYFGSSEELEIPHTVIKIGKNAFYDRKKLKFLTLGTSVQYIGFNPFVKSGIKWIKSKSNYFKILNNNLFSYNLKTLYFSFSEKSIQELPKNTETICRNAYASNSFIKGIHFNFKLKLVQRNAFNEAENLSVIRLKGEMPKIEKQTGGEIKWEKINY